MATGESLTYSRVLVEAFDTICRNLDLQKVGTKLINEKKLSKLTTKRIKYAVKKDDVKIFHALLIDMDMKSFAVFLEAVDSIQDEEHKQILTLLSHELQYLSLEGKSDEVVTRIESIRAKYVPGSEVVSPTAITEIPGSEMAQSSDNITTGSDTKLQGGENLDEPLVISESEMAQSSDNITPGSDTKLQGNLEVISESEMAQSSDNITTGSVQESENPLVSEITQSLDNITTGSDTKLQEPLAISESEVTQSTDYITTGFVQESENLEEPLVCGINPLVLYRKHLVETAVFSRTDHNTFYSPAHDITVSMEPGSFPAHLDKLVLSVTVNDYSHSITFPDCYKGMYSVLLSLKCDPHVQTFREPVTVTVPHSAVGDLGKLCVLVGTEDNGTLNEDPSIKIESFDERCLTFQTIHFSNHLLSEIVPPTTENTKDTKSKARSRRKELPSVIAKNVAKTASFDENLIRGPVLPPLQIPRSYSCPTSDTSNVDSRFLAVMFVPRDTATPHWQFALIVTDHLPTLSDELAEHASKILCVDNSNLRCYKDFFTFSNSYVELYPSDHSSNGCSIRSTVAQPIFVKECVEQYWHCPADQRAVISLPYIVYDVHRPAAGTSSHTSFTITLKGSKSLLDRPSPISFRVLCDAPPTYQSNAPQSTTSDRHYSVKIFREMYKTGPRFCPVVEGLSGGDCSHVLLRMNDEGDNNCCMLLCETSFHLLKWEDVGYRLGVESLDIDIIKEEYGKEKFYVRAFKLLSHWISSSECTPNLGALIEALQSCGFFIMLTNWATSYNAVIPRNMDNKLILKLAKLISCHWEFVARFLGLAEVDIDTIARSPSSPCDQADRMLCLWQKQCPLRARDAYLELFRSVHCVSEHIPISYLKAAVRSLE